MASTFTPNIGLEIPARGDDVGTWDTPMGNDLKLTDLVVGGIATIGLNNSNVVLSAAQFQCREIIFNSTLTGNVIITFPTSFTKSYEIYNACTGSSAFTITLATTAPGSPPALTNVCAPPGEIVEIVNDGTSLKYKNFGRIGEYVDYAGSAVPNWITFAAPPPYLLCDGSPFSSAIYPQLAIVLGGTTLPDARGRTRAALNQGTGRMTTANGGVDGNTNLAAGGADSVTLATSQIPAHTHGVTDPGHTHASVLNPAGLAAATGTAASGNPQYGNSGNTASATTGITINSAGGGALHTNMQPTYVGGLTLIRAG